jgi:hypothetical protein
MIWFWSANSRRPRSSIAASEAGDGSIRPCANLLQKRPALGGASTDEYMAVIALDCSPGRTRSERLGLDVFRARESKDERVCRIGCVS